MTPSPPTIPGISCKQSGQSVSLSAAEREAESTPPVWGLHLNKAYSKKKEHNSKKDGKSVEEGEKEKSSFMSSLAQKLRARADFSSPQASLVC